jgi:tetratricopeptide (TPR) repeat protein
MKNYLEKAIKEEKNYYAALYLMGDYYYITKEPVRSYEYLNRAVQAYNSPPEFTFDEFYHETEQYGAAYFLLGNIFYNFFDRVRYRFGDQLEEEELDSEIERLANYDIAREKYEAALALEFKSPELSYNLGRIYYMKNQYEKALERWLDLYEDFVERPELMLALGNAFYHLENLDASRGEYLKLVSVYEHEAESIKTVQPSRQDHLTVFLTLSSAYNNLGAVYQRKNDETKSSISYWKSIDYAKRIGRENEFARVNMGRAFKERSEPLMPILDENIPFSIDVYEFGEQ